MVAHFHRTCDNCSMVERAMVAHSSGHMAVAIDTILVEEHSVLAALETVDNLETIIFAN